ncbi:hypothetical protein I3A36_24115, partial [Salmonella enterica]|nr:hypothetical protein [Salmonella enterica]
MSNKIVFVNGKSKCGCVMAFSDGGGEYSDVHTIIPCAEHSMPESALTQRIAELEARTVTPPKNNVANVGDSRWMWYQRDLMWIETIRAAGIGVKQQQD